jgi:hypothetical protein
VNFLQNIFLLPEFQALRRLKAWQAVSCPPADLETSELLGLYFDLRTLQRGYLAVTSTEWWAFDVRARTIELADEIDRRIPRPR